MRTYKIRLVFFYVLSILYLGGLCAPGIVSAKVINTTTGTSYEHDLQKAINEANKGDTIEFEGTFEGSFTIQNKVDVILQGIGPNTTLKGVKGKRVVSILNSQGIHIKHCSIRGGDPRGDGGGILNKSARTHITRCDIIDNFAPSGGGIYTDQSLTIENSLIAANSAQLEGAGIYITSAEVHVIKSDISHNRLVRSTPSFAKGGGVYITNGGVVHFRDSRIDFNDARPGNGGGIYNNQSTVKRHSTPVVDNKPDNIYPPEMQ